MAAKEKKMTDNIVSPGFSVQQEFRREVAQQLGQVAAAAEALRQAGLSGRNCETLLEQVASLRDELDRTTRFLINHHLDHCAREALLDGRVEEVIQGVKQSLEIVMGSRRKPLAFRARFGPDAEVFSAKCVPNRVS